MDILKASSAAILGFILYVIFTNPKNLKKKIPKVSMGKIQILPNLKLRLRNQTIHLHHWILLSAVLGFLNHIAKGIDNLIYLKLFAIGGIIQGFTFKDRFQIFIKRSKEAKLSSYPSISVVIPAHNEEKFIARTLVSLKKQNYPGNFEIIVVDNASTDKTAQIAQNYGAKVVYEAQKGLPFARQRGFEEACGQLIASTDADIILPANWLTLFATRLISDDKIVAVSGWFKLKSGPKIPKIGINYLSIPAIFIYSKVFGKKLLLDPNFMVKRDAFFKVGGFRDLPAMLEDLQLAQKLGRVGQVKMLYGIKWSVVSSPRRWRKGLIAGALPYVVNALYFAVFGKVLSSNFTDIRDEKTQIVTLRTKLAYTIAAILMIFTFLSVPASPAHAKVAPVTKRVEKTISRTVSNAPNYLKKHFSRHHLKKVPALNV